MGYLLQLTKRYSNMYILLNSLIYNGPTWNICGYLKVISELWDDKQDTLYYP